MIAGGFGNESIPQRRSSANYLEIRIEECHFQSQPLCFIPYRLRALDPLPIRERKTTVICDLRAGRNSLKNRALGRIETTVSKRAVVMSSKASFFVVVVHDGRIVSSQTFRKAESLSPRKRPWLAEGASFLRKLRHDRYYCSGRIRSSRERTWIGQST